jgi:hypothetical protein
VPSGVCSGAANHRFTYRRTHRQSVTASTALTTRCHGTVSKEAGKTVSGRLSADEARLYREWIDNRRRLESVIEEMTILSRRAGEHLLEDTGRHFQGPPRPRRRARPAKRTRR